MKRNWLPNALLFAAAEYVLLPYLVWRMVSLWFPSADLRGPFLVASPFIAVSFVFLPLARYTWLRYLEPQDPEPGPEDLQKVVDAYATAIGRPGIEIVRSADGELYLRDPERTLKVSTPGWEKLYQEQRHFLIARTLAHAFGQKTTPGRHLGHASTMAIGMAIATLNLWYVLPVHASLAALLVLEGYAPMKRRTIQADLAALQLTRNLSAAIDTVRQETPGTSLVAPEDRLRALRQCAADMGLN